jgi:Malectin domain
MMQVSASNLADLERAELESVLAALARTPRLAKLLSYVAERYFSGRTDEITEYNIATEVFGRSKTMFDSSQDSIARVEAYRLRRRLKEHYQTAGKEHEIQIALPSGSYVPSFIRCASSAPATSAPAPQVHEDELEELSSALAPEPEMAPDSAETKINETNQAGSRVRTGKSLYRLAAIAALLLLTFGAVWFFWRDRSTNLPKAGASQPLNLNQPTPQNAAQVPLRLLAGYDGSPRIDSSGAYWQADRYVTGEAGFTRPDAPVARTSDPMLFEHWRTGNFSYDIPLAPGPYELHLFFVASQPNEYFDVSINGQSLLPAFDISSDAFGINIADERVFKDIYPDKDGYLHLKFSGQKSTPSLNALEILPGLPHKQQPVRLVMQPTAVTDHDGILWHPDTYFQGGVLSDPPRSVSGTPDPSLYAHERFGHFSYSIPVDARGRYTLVLHFAELYWVPDRSGSIGVGSRIFRVYCNGSTLLDNFDIFKEVGSLHALTKTFHHLRPTPEGKLDLTFDPIVNYATISAIEVIDESE